MQRPIHKFIHKYKRQPQASVQWLPHENLAHHGPLYGKLTIFAQQSLTIQPKAALPITLRIVVRLRDSVCSVLLRQSLKETRCSLQDGIIAESVDDIIVTIQNHSDVAVDIVKGNSRCFLSCVRSVSTVDD